MRWRIPAGVRAQIYHVNLFKLWNEEHPVLLVMSVIEEGELRPEVQKVPAFTRVHSESHLSPHQMTEVAEIQQCFADDF